MMSSDAGSVVGELTTLLGFQMMTWPMNPTMIMKPLLIFKMYSIKLMVSLRENKAVQWKGTSKGYKILNDVAAKRIKFLLIQNYMIHGWEYKQLHGVFQGTDI